jgi:hypothetical protein
MSTTPFRKEWMQRTSWLQSLVNERAHLLTPLNPKKELTSSDRGGGGKEIHCNANDQLEYLDAFFMMEGASVRQGDGKPQ